jgi:tripartite-type tricarboxylate transporter receptor subunit TctC
MVSADSEYETAEDLLAAIREQADPGTFTASGTGQGGIWHLGIAGWLLSEGLDPNSVTWVPSQGAAPGLQDLVAGGVDIVPSSLPEGRALIEAGRVRPLATMGEERLDIFPDVPTLPKPPGLTGPSAPGASSPAPRACRRRSWTCSHRRSRLSTRARSSTSS